MPNKLSEKEAVAFMRKAGLKPLEPYVNSGSPWKSKCLKCKLVVSPSLGNVRTYGAGCWECGIKKRSENRRTPAAEAILKMRKAGLEPLEDYLKNSTPWKSQCKKCKRIVSPTYASIVRGSGGCKFCGSEKTSKKLRFSDEDTSTLMISKGYKPLEKYPGSSKPWKSKCLSCNSIVFPNYSNTKKRNKSKYGCIYCAGMKVHIKDVEKMMLKAGIRPLEKYLGKDVPWKSKCLTCGNITYPTAGNIRRGQGGCAYCRETGLNYSDPAYIYLIFHEEYSSIKIGVSNLDSRPNRIKAHQKNGWSVYKIYNLKNGKAAEEIETHVLRWLRKTKQLPVHLSPKMMPQGGHSETVSALEIALPTIWVEVLKRSKVQR
jgi:hypothetical protein